MPGFLLKKPLRMAGLGLVTAAVLVVIGWVAKTYLGDRLDEQVSLYNVSMAAVLDPKNAAYQLQLGRFYQYNPADMNPEQAMVHIQRAVRLTPYDPDAWLDLGAALEFQGDTAQAEACLRRADYLAPNLPPIQWAIGNFFLLHGNVDEAFRHFKVVLKGSNRYNQFIFDTAWKASGDASTILDELIPTDPDSAFAYLEYLRSRKNYEAAASVWKRILGGPATFPAWKAANYIDGLLETHRPLEAYGVWENLRDKGLIASTFTQTRKNLILNGDWEEPLLNFGFDWRLIPIEGAYAALDQTTFHSPSHSVLIQFTGNQNVTYQNVRQHVRVEPNRSYRLQGFMRTQGITTDSGPRLEVRDAYDARLLDKLSEDLRGDNLSWTQLVIDFKTPPNTQMVTLTVTRLPSSRFDNLIAGRAWLDDVTLLPRTEEQSLAH